MPIITQAPNISFSSFDKRLRRLSEREAQEQPEPLVDVAANENAIFSMGVYDARPPTRNQALIAAQNNAVLVEGRPENVYGENCIPCRETYRKADVNGSALVPVGVAHQDRVI